MTFQPEFYDHEIVQQSPDDYYEMTLNAYSVLKAWSSSLFAHELLKSDGTIKDQSEMSDGTLDKYITATELIKKQESIAKPIIGVGMMDGIEIGVGREIIAVCHQMNIDTIPVQMRKAQRAEIEKLLPSVPND